MTLQVNFVISLFIKEKKKKDSGKLYNLPKDAQIIEGKAGLQIQISLALKIIQEGGSQKSG